METRIGSQFINNGEKKAIIEFIFANYIIYVFQGTISQFDILIKYKKEGSRIRTPKHIHWVVDVLMKMQGNEIIAREFLSEIKNCWDSCVPLVNNDYAALEALIERSKGNINIERYSCLNDFGEYDVEFLYVMMELLAVQEKTNRTDAYMFGNVIDELLNNDRDIFKIVSKAGFGGRKS